MFHILTEFNYNWSLIFIELATDEDEIDETLAFANEKKKSTFMLTVSIYYKLFTYYSFYNYCL